MKPLAFITVIINLALPTAAYAEARDQQHASKQHSEQRSAQHAQQHPKGSPFDHMDEDQDGHLSRGEVRGPLKRDFERFDQNQDGLLSRAEVPEPPQRRGHTNRPHSHADHQH